MLRVSFMLFFFILAHGFSNVYGQRFNVTGKVTDATTGLPIFQLSVVEKNSGIGTITNDKGNYSLFINAGKVELIFSEINYEPVKMEFTLRGDTLVDVSMDFSSRDRLRLFRRDQSAMLESYDISKPAKK